MLAIKTEKGWVEWHLGEETPKAAHERVVTFQADGDELNLFLQAMYCSQVLHKGIHYTKRGGFSIDGLG